MKRRLSLRTILSTALLVTALCAITAAPASAVVYTVLNIADSGAGSLRDAITLANANAGLDSIYFNIAGGPGPYTITPLSALPTITDPLLIDGYSQPGAVQNTNAGFTGGTNAVLMIDLDGSLSGGVPGLQSAAVCVFRGLAIGNFTVAINLSAGASVVAGCFVGTDVTGTSARGNSTHGIIINGVSGCTIGGPTAAKNIISGSPNGVFVTGGATGSFISNNLIGTDYSGTVALANQNGILISGGSSNNTIGGLGINDGNLISGNSVGGTVAGARNLISSNALYGVRINGADGNTVAGNYIGTDVTGLGALPNLSGGVNVFGGSGNTIGATTVDGRNVISGNSSHGVALTASATNNMVIGNYIGTDYTGAMAVANGQRGVFVATGSNNSIGGTGAGEGNVISGNGAEGIFVTTGNANSIVGNRIGIDAAGTSALGNGGDGVQFLNADSNVVGGNTSAHRNTIGGNTHGILIAGTSTENDVFGNYIGTDVSGSGAIPNGRGVRIISPATNNHIGGAGAATSNVISGNSTFGVDLDGASGNFVERNLIGTDASGGAALGNLSHGVHINFGGSGNTIGGDGTGNTIAGNGGDGVAIISAGAIGNTVQGNQIGNNGTIAIANVGSGVRVAGGSGNLIGAADGGPGEQGNTIGGNDGNGVSIVGDGANSNVVRANNIGVLFPNAGHGVLIGSGGASSNNRIGSANMTDKGNIITNNALNGVAIENGTGNELHKNTIEANGGLEIDLGLDGVTANDPSDLDAGPNGLQNFPVVASSHSNSTTVQGTFNGAPNTVFLLEFYDSDTCDPSGYGAAQHFLGELSVATNGSGDASFNTTFPFTVPIGNYVSATATDDAGNTSEFSLCSQVIPAPLLVTTEVDSGAGSLRQAILDANAQSGPDSIHFAIPGGGIHVLTLAGAMPAITEAVVIDGYSQPGASPNSNATFVASNAVIMIALDGTSAGVADGLVLNSGGSTILGLSIDGFDGNGVTLAAGSNVIAGCFVGVDASGTTGVGNSGDGIYITDGAQQIGGADPSQRNVISNNSGNGVYATNDGSTANVLNNFVGTDRTGGFPLGNQNDGVLITGTAAAQIGAASTGNLISGNAGDGIELTGTASVLVLGNRIGTDAAGDSAIANGIRGVYISGGAGGHEIGGTGAGEGNVISGNDFGVITSASSATTISGNYIGTDATGTSAIPNTSMGIDLHDAGNIVGGTTFAERNIISGNGGVGVRVFGASASATIMGNFVGTDVTGTSAIPNVNFGVLITAGASGAVGGPNPGEGNVVSGNGTHGVYLSNTTGVPVQGNLIGTDSTGTFAMGNTGRGVNIELGNDNLIGGSGPGEANVIAYNGQQGVAVVSGGGNNRILGNSIHSNSGLGIDLEGDGVTSNDVGDGDAGSNDLQNFPLFTSSTSNSTNVQGTLASASSTQYTLEFFWNTSCDPSGNGEGETYLGSVVVMTDSSGVAAFDTTFALTVPVGDYVTATATDETGNTSEFSLCSQITAQQIVVTNSNDSGAGSLRDAITQANNTAALDTITFDIPGAGPHTIALLSALPVLTYPVVIDGLSQPGASGNSNGALAANNAVEMIELDGSAAGSTSALVLQGGASMVRGLVINRFQGAAVELASNNNTIVGNFLGTSVAGTTALGNQYGVYGDGSGFNSITDNLISGNAVAAIASENGLGSNVIQGNLIGTNAAGTAARANGSGIRVSGPSNVIGGELEGEPLGNVISGNDSAGVVITGIGATGNFLEYNNIGAGVTGAALGNTGHGVLITGGASDNTVGYNVIRNNGGDGVAAVGGSTTGNDVSYNSMFTNGGLGIDLGDDGVTPNDSADVDSGDNGLQNFPVLTFTESDGSSTLNIEGTLNSSPNTNFEIHFYVTTLCDPSAHGEGEQSVGTISVATDGSGDAAFAMTYDAAIPVGSYLTATATDDAGNTSEFSMCSELTPPPGDLELVLFNAPLSASLQEDIASGVYIVIDNAGANDVTSSFSVGLFHSTDAIITNDDQFIARTTLTGLAAGDSAEVTFTVATVPFQTPLGNGYFGVIVDELDSAFETDEGNNTAAVATVISAPTPVGQIVVYYDENFTQLDADCPGTVFDTLYVVAENINSQINGAAYKVNLPSVMNFVADLDTPPIRIGNSQDGISVSWGLFPQDATGQALLQKIIVQWTCDGCVGFDDPLTVVPHPAFGYVEVTQWPTNDVIITSGGESYVCVDSDGDGVLNGIDQCPFVSAANYDADGDGCVDLTADNRRIEYWNHESFPIDFVINQSGAPGIDDGSEFTEIQNALATWNGVPGVGTLYSYAGQTAQGIANAMDEVNLVTFVDPVVFPPGVLALGIATSFDAPTFYNGRLYRPGELLDFDMIFNRAFMFSTAADGAGAQVLDIAVHEGGHGLGFSHDVTQTATMAYVLTPGAETLEQSDIMTAFMGYADSATVNAASELGGTIIDGYTGNPIAAAVVFAIDAGTGDTSGCAITRSDGSYIFVGLPDGDYFVGIHPLDGSLAINRIEPKNINPIVFGTSIVNFAPESWDIGESSTDNSEDRSPVTVVAGASMLGIDIITNIDNTAPFVLSVTPPDGAIDVSIGGVILIKFSESINTATVVGNVTLRDTTAGQFLGGSAIPLQDDSLLTFLPSGMTFGHVYELKIKTGLTDAFNNPIASEFVSHFTTVPQPAVFVSGLSPNSGPAGAVVTIDGGGFEASLSDNMVTFNGVAANVLQANGLQLVVQVPAGAASGQVVVQNVAQATTSNSLPFTVLQPQVVSKGSSVGAASVGSLPRAVTLLPDASRAFVATSVGLAVVETDASVSSFLTSSQISVPGGLDGIDATPVGTRVYAVSTTNSKMYRIQTDEAPIDIDNEMPVTGGQPLGILVYGQRAFVPTNLGRMTIWDLNQANPTFEQQIGFIQANPNLRGRMAVAQGRWLLGLSGTGKLLVFDMQGDSLFTSVTVGPNPKGVAANPQGDRAYVTDAGGTVRVVSLTSFNVLQTISTGGSLRQPVVTPNGAFLFAANRELNLFDVIDLRPGPTFHQIVGTPPLGINPTAAEIGSDGLFAFATSEMSGTLNAIAIGTGSTIETIMPPAGPVGAKLVIAGSGFGADSLVQVSFGSVLAVPTVRENDRLVVTVPGGAMSGPVTIVGTNPTGPQSFSNEVFFEILGPTQPGATRISGGAQPTGAPALNAAIAVADRGGFTAVGGGTGVVYFFDTDPTSASFNQFFDQAAVSPLLDVDDVAVTPDGKRTFALSEGNPTIVVVQSDRFGSGFTNVVGNISLSGFAGSFPVRLAVSPDGRTLLIADPGYLSVHVVDIAMGSPSLYQVTNTVSLTGTGTDAGAREIVFHPAGRFAYVAVDDPAANTTVLVLDMTTETIVGNTTITGTAPFEVPLALAFKPDGNVCMVVTSQILAVPSRTLRAFDTSDPANPTAIGTVPIAGGGVATPEHLDVSPAGDRAIVNVRDSGFYHYNIQNPASISLIEVTGDTFHHLAGVDFAYSANALTFQSVSAFRDSLFVQDFAQSQTLAIDSGNGQSGIAGQQLSLPLKVRVTNDGGEPLPTPAPGVAIKFNVTAGGGVFVGTGTATRTVLTGSDGKASVNLILGSATGTGVHQVSASAGGLNGSPVLFSLDAVVDPATLPLAVVSSAPPSGQVGVSITSNLQATFSRAVSPSSIGPATFRVLDGSTPVPVSYGFADGNRRVSMTPLVPLDFGTTYTMEMTTGILDAVGGALSTPLTTTFDTQAPPPLSLNSIDPPSGPAGIPVVISGVGIDPDPSGNVVTFSGGVPAVVAAAGNDFLTVNVPYGAVSGPITVERLTALTSGPQATSVAQTTMDFIVLETADETSGEVIANIGTGTPIRTLSITPDGLRAYATSDDAVVPIDLVTLTSGLSIPAGLDIVSIVISPDGDFAYTANNGSGTISIIDVDPASPNFETNVGNINVGQYPSDIAIHPDGDVLFVVNSGSDDISVIDTDENSATFHAVIANIFGGTGAPRTLSITPDGARLFVGGDEGVAILDAHSYGVIANIGTGNTGIRSLSITPDGAKLVALTLEGQIVVYDIVPSSPSENQVIGIFGGGNQQVRTLSVTPDGAQIWATQELSDEILVLSLEIGGDVSVIEIPSSATQLAVIASVDAGEDPAFVAFDPSGVGNVYVVNPGDKTLTVISRTISLVDATVVVDPHTVHVWNIKPDDPDREGLHIKAGFRFFEATIELPQEPVEYLAEDISPNSVVLFGDMLGDRFGLFADASESYVADANENGVDELHVFFDRLKLQLRVPDQQMTVPVAIMGEVAGRRFKGSDVIETIIPDIIAPAGGHSVPVNAATEVAWRTPAGVAVDRVDVLWTPDGKVWNSIAEKVPDKGSVQWTTPAVHYSDCRVIVILYRGHDEIGAALSQETFAIGGPQRVSLASVEVVQHDRGASLVWSTAFESGIDGFHVLRSEAEESGYARVSTAILPARGKAVEYRFDDEDVRFNQTYYYMLQEVEEGRDGQTFGPYEFVYKARFALEQNAPNPFNPTTVIRFTVPEASHVKLVIYDVAGRHVRTLIDEMRTANHYDATWDGKDTHGRAVASGVYFYRMQAGKHQATKKMVMLK